jgi:hypothetical protein
MPVLSTPFWIATDRRAGVPSPVLPACAPNHVAAFTVIERAHAYLSSKRLVCEIGLVSTRTLGTVAEVYRLLGVKGFCVDPAADGTSAGTISFHGVQQQAGIIAPDDGDSDNRS